MFCFISQEWWWRFPSPRQGAETSCYVTAWRWILQRRAGVIHTRHARCGCWMCSLPVGGDWSQTQEGELAGSIWLSLTAFPWFQWTWICCCPWLCKKYLNFLQRIKWDRHHIMDTLARSITRNHALIILHAKHGRMVEMPEDHRVLHSPGSHLFTALKRWEFMMYSNQGWQQKSVSKTVLFHLALIRNLVFSVWNVWCPPLCKFRYPKTYGRS